MRVPVPTWRATLNFDALGRTLRHYSGNGARVDVLALVPGERDGYAQAVPVAVLKGVFTLVSEVPEADAPPEAVQAGELAHLIEIAGAQIPISNVDLVGATFDPDERVARWRVGPVVYCMDIDNETGAD